MTKFLLSIPKKSLYSEFGSHEFQFSRLQVCVPNSSARANFIECCIAFMHFGSPKVHFIRARSMVLCGNCTLKYDKVFVFYFPMEFLFLIWISLVPIFEGPKSPCSFHQHGPTLLSGLLLVMHFGNPRVNFIKLEAWFYNNGTLKCDKVFVFYSPKESLFWFWLSRVPIFEGPKFVCLFYQEGANFMEWCTACYAFWHPKSPFH